MLIQEKITRWFHIIVASAGAMTADYFMDAFTKLGFSGNWYLVGPALLAIIGMNAIDAIVSWSIDHLRVFRLILAGRDDIEGDWVNVVCESSTPDKIIAAELTRIYYRRGRYVVSGDTWSLEGAWLGSFVSEASLYRGRTIEYFYKAGDGRKFVGGYGVIWFNPSDSEPTNFSCYYLDELSQTPHMTRGCRIGRWLTAKSFEERKEAALDFARKPTVATMLPPMSKELLKITSDEAR